MKWRVMVEVTGEDGAMTQHIISTGERADAGQAATLGLNLGESKVTLAGLQRVLVTARIDAHCRRRRSCGHCKALRPLKDHRSRTLVSLFGKGGGARASLRTLPVRRGLSSEPDPGRREDA